MQSIDKVFMRRAIELALETEKKGNPPVGSVIMLDKKIIAEGACTLFSLVYDPKCHAEMNALDKVDPILWPRAKEMNCYTTLEPCCMCFGRLLLSGIGRIVFGAVDKEGGSGCLIQHLPKFYNETNIPAWVGPLMPEQCDKLFHRTFSMFTRGIKNISE